MSHGARAAFLALTVLLPVASAWADTPAATLKLQVQIDSGVIKVADLWVNAGAKSGTVVGPSPQPGRAIAIEAGQLAYIARLYEVNWRPTSGVERASVERAGRPLTREEMAEPIKRSLVEAGAPASVTIELVNFAPVLVPPMSFPLLSVEAIAYDPGSDRFSVNVAASAEGMQTQRMRVAGRVAQTVAAVVANRRLQAGDVIGPADVRLTQYPEKRLAGPVADDLSQVIGQSPRRTIVAGQPLAPADFGPPMMIAKGATVVVVVESPGILLAAQGIALGAGGREDVIQIMNPLSRAVIAARVTGPGRASINPGSAPLVAPVKTGTPASMEVAN